MAVTKRPTRELSALFGGVVLALLLGLPANGATFNLLYSFEGGTNDGAEAIASTGAMTPVGSLLFGMTDNGGASGDGTIFTFNPVTNAETVVHSFSDGPGDGAHPQSTLSLSTDGTTLYGTTLVGGTGFAGNAFGFNLATEGVNTIYSFGTSIGGSDGIEPAGGLVQSGSTLYGLAGDGGKPVLFALNIINNTEAPLYYFAGPPDGAGDSTTPVLVGNVLYGTTTGGGSGSLGNRNGTI